MIQEETRLVVADNSGAKEVACIRETVAMLASVMSSR